MPKLALEFEDPALERAYRDDLFEHYQQRQARIGLGLGVAATPALALLDWLVIPDAFPRALTLRFGVTLPVVLACFLLWLTRHFRRLYLTAVMLFIGVGWWMFFYLGSIAKPPGSFLYVTWGAVWTIPFMLTFRLTWRAMLLVTSEVAALYFITEFAGAHHPPPARIFLGFTYVNLVGIGTWMAWTAEQIQRTLFLQKKEIAAERARSDALLLNILPETIAARLKA